MRRDYGQLLKEISGESANHLLEQTCC